MNTDTVSTRIKIIRKRKGFSQEQLAELSGLSLRTIQRIENGETEPRGDSIKRLAEAFDTPAEELSDWTIKEDNGALMGLNPSGLICALFPILGIIVTLIIWWNKRNTVNGARELGRDVLNFQITITALSLLGTFFVVFAMVNAFDSISESGNVSPEIVADSITSAMSGYLYTYVFLNVYNFLITIINTIRISNGKKARYFPKVPFIKA